MRKSNILPLQQKEDLSLGLPVVPQAF